jgi:hypothetical protein
MEPSPDKCFKTFGWHWFQGVREKNFEPPGTFCGFRFPLMNASQTKKRPGKPGRSRCIGGGEGLMNPSD